MMMDDGGSRVRASILQLLLMFISFNYLYVLFSSISIELFIGALNPPHPRYSAIHRTFALLNG